MHLAVLGVLVREVLLHVLGQQVAPVARGIDQHVVGGLRHRAVEDRLQRLVARLAFIEAQVVAEHDEVLRTLGHQVDDIGQIDKVGLVDLDEAQPAAAQLVEAGLDERALARAARTRQQHVVRAVPLHELQRVAQQAFLLRLDLAQVGQADGGDMAHRLQPAGPASLAVAKRHRRRPVGCGERMRQNRLEARHQRLRAREQGIEIGHGPGLSRPRRRGRRAAIRPPSGAARHPGVRSGCA